VWIVGLLLVWLVWWVATTPAALVPILVIVGLLGLWIGWVKLSALEPYYTRRYERRRLALLKRELRDLTELAHRRLARAVYLDSLNEERPE
jgi:hypothetical protein